MINSEKKIVMMLKNYFNNVSLYQLNFILISSILKFVLISSIKICFNFIN